MKAKDENGAQRCQEGTVNILALSPPDGLVFGSCLALQSPLFLCRGGKERQHHHARFLPLFFWSQEEQHR